MSDSLHEAQRTPANGRPYIVRLCRDVDVYVAAEVEKLLAPVLADGHAHVVVSLAQARSIDSVGLGVLLGALQRVRRRGGTFALVCTHPQIRKAFDITGLRHVVALFHDEDEAVHALLHAGPRSELR